jgi:hypothetical protein
MGSLLHKKNNQSIFRVWPGAVGLGPQRMLLSRSHLMVGLISWLSPPDANDSYVGLVNI